MPRKSLKTTGPLSVHVELCSHPNGENTDPVIGASCVDGFGESMGAALVLESMRAEPRFCALVADSPFSTFRSVAYDREGFFVGVGRLGLEPVVGRTLGLLATEIALGYASWRYRIDLRRANPLDAVRSSSIPVLLIHGEEDINILPRHSRILVKANPAHAQLWLVPRAQHGGAVVVAPQEFWSRVLAFLARHDSLPKIEFSRTSLCRLSCCRAG